ncbi:MAG: peptidase [Gammaproteobacteria bacterium]
MTYCLAITVNAGLVFASDSRTHAGVDQVATYSKMHTFGCDGERQVVLLNAGNLATTQAVVTRIRRDRDEKATMSIDTARDMADLAEYVGRISRAQGAKHGRAVARAGFSTDATFIVGGQIGQEPPQIFLVYPQGNFITTSGHTRFLQVGEAKYGKPILDRIIQPSTSLEEAALCALVSMDSTMRSNVTVGPPIEILCYVRDSLRLERYRCLKEDDPYLIDVRRAWNEKIAYAFAELPPLAWMSIASRVGCS